MMMTILGPLVLDLHLQESAFQSSPSSIIGVNALSARKASLLLKRHSSTSMTYLSALNLQVHFYLWLRGGCSLLRTCFRPEHFSGLATTRQTGLLPSSRQHWNESITIPTAGDERNSCLFNRIAISFL